MPLSSQGFLTLPSSRATPPPQPEGRESTNKEGSPKIHPHAGRGQSRIHCLCHPTPTTAAPAPPPPRGSRSSRTIAGPAQGRALPSPPAVARGSHHGTARPRQVASGDRGGPVGVGADPQGTRGSILISISAPSSTAASRASSSPVVNWDQLIRVNFSQSRLTGRRERCSAGREEREGVEPDASEGEEGHAQLPGKCRSPKALPLPHPGSRGPE